MGVKIVVDLPVSEYEYLAKLALKGDKQLGRNEEGRRTSKIGFVCYCARERIKKTFERALVWDDFTLFNEMVKNIQSRNGKERKETCRNIAEDYADVDQFVCSECGIELQEWHGVERDEDTGDESFYEYTLKYCPNCGRKIKYED